MKKLEVRVSTLESKKTEPTPVKPQKKEAPKDDDDDVDLFGSESEVSIYITLILLRFCVVLGFNIVCIISKRKLPIMFFKF